MGISQLQELVGIIAATLNARLSKEDANLLRDDVEKFKVRKVHLCLDRQQKI